MYELKAQGYETTQSLAQGYETPQAQTHGYEPRQGDEWLSGILGSGHDGQVYSTLIEVILFFNIR
jgi:hypothetical protein